MKLLFFIYSLQGGGAERATVSLANYWSAQGWQVTIVTLLQQESDFYKLHPRVRRLSLDLASDGSNPFVGVLNNVRRIWALRRVLRQVEPDVAVAMMTTANVLLAFAAYGITPAIGTEQIHPPRVATGRVWRLLRRWSYGKLAAVAVLTEETKAWLQANTLARRIAVIPNGLQWPLAIHAPVLEPRHVVPEGKRVLLAVGRLDQQKGFDWLIQVFATLVATHPNWNLVILGEGPQRKSLETQISERRLNAAVFLPGAVGNVAQWYLHAHLYVSSSRFEGLPNTLFEALAHGLPVVSFDCETGPRDIIRNEIDGLLVPTGNLPGLTSALNRLMSDEATRRIFADRAVEARERFSMERIGSMWEALFMKVRTRL
jgi:glycosyltransferase involved in cell wall biosynthesis